MTDRRALPDFVRVLLGLHDASLRVAWAADAFRTIPACDLAPLLDDVAIRAEQGNTHAKQALVALVDALALPGLALVTSLLREEAAGGSWLALDRLIRQPLRSVRPSSRPASMPPEAKEARVPDYGFGRPLTLGERKSLARKNDRGLLARLLLDPHPDVIGGLLRNPRLTEDDVIRLVAKRPSRPEILAEIARSPKWVHRSRVRLAIVLNPDTPHELAVPLTSLLLRHELRLVAESSHLADALRAVCHEHLARRPPRKETGTRTVQ